MFFRLVMQNSRRSRKESGLFFATLLISIAAFYIVLSLSHQDVMRFLVRMESGAVDRLLSLIPAFYGLTLFILFFLIYYASKFQLERRRHEFGVYLMMGMRRRNLFLMLLAEDFGNSILALLIGLPAAVLLSELISLVTARLAGIGLIGHHVSFSPQAVLWTSAGFLLTKLAAFLILSGRIAGQEIASLLVETPEGSRKQMPSAVYASAMAAGIVCLACAYGMAISGLSWSGIGRMGITIALGLLGTMLLFYGLRFLIGVIVKCGRKDRRLHVFDFRQIQENVIQRSGTLAVSSLLILAALCCFGAGAALVRFYGDQGSHVLDYTFDECEENADAVRKELDRNGLDHEFLDLFEMKTGQIRITEDIESAFQMDSVMSALRETETSAERDILLNNLEYAYYPYLISLDSYNHLLSAAGLKPLELEADEAGVYMDREFVTYERTQMLNQILEDRPEVCLAGKKCHLAGQVQTTDLITDRSITLSFALILPDEGFEYYTQGEYNVFLNGILKASATEGKSLMQAISDMNGKLDKTGLSYESYLQNMGRQLFYMVAAGYITIYLAVVFLIIANTVIGVQFLMGQQKANRRYKTLVRLGAEYETLCRSSERQIRWYFGIPVAVAAVSSLFGVRALFEGLLSGRVKGGIPGMLLVSGAVIFVLCVVEYAYMTAVKRAGNRYLLTLMEPEREE